MARPLSPGDSPLSSMGSDDADGPLDDSSPPKKRMKLAQASTSASPSPPTSVLALATTASALATNTVPVPVPAPAPAAPDADAYATMPGADVTMAGADDDEDDSMLDGVVSEDSDGDVPGSPIGAGASSGLLTVSLLTRPEDDDFQEQVTQCAWEGCTSGDKANMDRLVEHVHSAHIEGRQKLFTCEWVGCSRKSMPHASAYALKAHVRSHTREKPFYCYLPECDRAFTRSDALAKHMRTVHETEALRPSDPVPKSMQTAAAAAAAAAMAGAAPAPGKTGKLKIIIKTPQAQSTGNQEGADENNNNNNDGDGDGDDAARASLAEALTQMTEEQGFTEKELAMPIQRLVKLCRRQEQWAEAEAKELHKECRALEALYKQEWLEKEVLLDQVVQSEQDYHSRRQAVLAAAAATDVVVVNGGGTGKAAAAGAPAKPSRKMSARLAASRAAAARPTAAAADGGASPPAGHAVTRKEAEVKVEAEAEAEAMAEAEAEAMAEAEHAIDSVET